MLCRIFGLLKRRKAQEKCGFQDLEQISQTMEVVVSQEMSVRVVLISMDTVIKVPRERNEE